MAIVVDLFFSEVSADSFDQFLTTNVHERMFRIMPFAHAFTYPPARLHADRPPLIEATRDSIASLELRLALFDQGFGFGKTILNVPPKERTFDRLPESELRHVDMSFADPGDLLCGTTRPGLSEFKQNDKKKVENSQTTLERAVFRVYERYFRRCSRSSVVLTERAASFLPEEFKSRANMTFFQKNCRYKELHTLDPDGKAIQPPAQCTAAFLLRVDHLWPNGPGFVGAWSMNAQATLAWCTQLRTTYSQLLDNRGLTVVEIHLTDDVPEQPDTHDWVHDWKVTPMMETGVELHSQPESPRI